MKKEKKKEFSNCLVCGEEFEKKRKWSLFCCDSCRFKNWDKNNPRVKAGHCLDR